MKDKTPSKKEIEQNIKLALDKIDSDGEQKVLDGLKTALENYLEDREFIIKLLKTLVSRTKDVKAENNHLASELRKWSAIFQRTGYFLRWRDRETLEWNEKRYSDDFIKYRKNIDRYFVGSDENDNMILKYPNKKEDRLPPYLFENMKSKLSIEDAEQLYKEKDKEVLVEEEEKNIWDMLTEKGFDGRKEPCIEEVWNAIFDLRGIRLKTTEIVNKSKCSRSTVLKYLMIFKEYGWIKNLGTHHNPMWSLSDSFIRLKRFV